MIYYQNAKSKDLTPISLSEQISNYFTKILKSANPTKAPNYWTMPKKDSRNAPSKTNYTTKPVDLKVIIKSNEK